MDLYAGWFSNNVPDLTQRPLSVCAIERNEGPELIPSGLQLAPFLEVGVLHSCLVELLLSFDITVLNAEPTDVHAPERDTRHRIVKTCRELCSHILPTCADVAAPTGCAVALFSGKSAAGKQEYALVGVHRTLAVVYRVGIYYAVGIEVFGRGAEGGRSTEGFRYHIGVQSRTLGSEASIHQASTPNLYFE